MEKTRSDRRPSSFFTYVTADLRLIKTFTSLLHSILPSDLPKYSNENFESLLQLSSRDTLWDIYFKNSTSQNCYN